MSDDTSIPGGNPPMQINLTTNHKTDGINVLYVRGNAKWVASINVGSGSWGIPLDQVPNQAFSNYWTALTRLTDPSDSWWSTYDSW